MSCSSRGGGPGQAAKDYIYERKCMGGGAAQREERALARVHGQPGHCRERGGHCDRGLGWQAAPKKGTGKGYYC